MLFRSRRTIAPNKRRVMWLSASINQQQRACFANRRCKLVNDLRAPTLSHGRTSLDGNRWPVFDAVTHAGSEAAAGKLVPSLTEDSPKTDFGTWGYRASGFVAPSGNGYAAPRFQAIGKDAPLVRVEAARQAGFPGSMHPSLPL